MLPITDGLGDARSTGLAGAVPAFEPRQPSRGPCPSRLNNPGPPHDRDTQEGKMGQPEATLTQEGFLPLSLSDLMRGPVNT